MPAADLHDLLNLAPDASESDAHRAVIHELRRARAQRDRAVTAKAMERHAARVRRLESAARRLGVAVDAADEPAANATWEPSTAPSTSAAASPSPSKPKSGTVSWTTAAIAALLVAAGVAWYGMQPSVHTHPVTGQTFAAVDGGSFWIGQHEVTMRDFQRFAAATRYVTDAEKSGACMMYRPGQDATDRAANWRSAFIGASDTIPVTCVSWNDARAFAAWLSRTDPQSRYRLPTQAEWQRIAGASGGPYSFGGASGIARHANLAGQEAGFAWASEISVRDGFSSIAPTGTFDADDAGLFDLHGNVWEWTTDAHPKPGYRVIRGGGWATHPANATVSVVNGLPQSAASNDTGFRLLRLPSPSS